MLCPKYKEKYQVVISTFWDLNVGIVPYFTKLDLLEVKKEDVLRATKLIAERFDFYIGSYC